MKLGDVYVNKKDKSIIQIDSYATHMGNFPEKSIVVFRQMEKHNAYEIGSIPSFNGYGSREEIELEYELLVPQEKLKNYSDWNEIFDMVEKIRWKPVFKEGSKMKESIKIESLIRKFEDMAKRESLLARGNITQNDLLIQIIGTIVHVAMEEQDAISKWKPIFRIKILQTTQYI